MSKKLPILVKLVEPQPTQIRHKHKKATSFPLLELSESEESQLTEISKIIFSKETPTAQKDWEKIGAFIFGVIQTSPNKDIKEVLHLAQNIITNIFRNSLDKNK